MHKVQFIGNKVSVSGDIIQGLSEMRKKTGAFSGTPAQQPMSRRNLIFTVVMGAPVEIRRRAILVAH